MDSFESESYLSLKKELKDYYGNDQIFKSVLTNPSEGMV